jgi:site-specific recombinase XerD
MLTLFRRHLKGCPHGSRRYRRCQCPIHVEGSLRGEKIRKALDLNSWEAASDLITGWNASGIIGVIKPEVPTVAEAVAKFFVDAMARKLAAPTIKKLKNLLEKRLIPWCDREGYRLLKQLDVDALREVRATWPDAPISALKNLERLRSFFRFCHLARWVETNPAVALKPPKLGDKSKQVKVFTPEQLQTILNACETYPQHNAYGHDNRARIRALVLTLRYSGMRIGDCVGLATSDFKGDKLFLNTEKSGTKIYVPLPPVARGALQQIQNGSQYFFWTREWAAQIGSGRLAARPAPALQAGRGQRPSPYVSAHVRD